MWNSPSLLQARRHRDHHRGRLAETQVLLQLVLAARLLDQLLQRGRRIGRHERGRGVKIVLPASLQRFNRSDGPGHVATAIEIVGLPGVDVGAELVVDAPGGQVLQVAVGAGARVGRAGITGNVTVHPSPGQPRFLVDVEQVLVNAHALRWPAAAGRPPAGKHRRIGHGLPHALPGRWPRPGPGNAAADR